MKLEMMTCVSHILTVAAIFLAFLSVVLFFMLDIRRLWAVLYGKSTVTRRLLLPPQKARRIKEASVTERLATQVLKENAYAGTVLLDGTEETAALGTIELSLIQNITYTEYLPEEARI